jgi:hypothetical protein
MMRVSAVPAPPPPPGGALGRPPVRRPHGWPVAGRRAPPAAAAAAAEEARWQAGGLGAGYLEAGKEEVSAAGTAGAAGAAPAPRGYDFYGRAAPAPRARRRPAPVPAAFAAPAPAEGVRAVYRDSPFLAERRRAREGPAAARVLVLDEGGEARALLAAALLRAMLARLSVRLDVEVIAGSVGAPSAPGPAGRARLAAVAADLGLDPSDVHPALAPPPPPAPPAFGLAAAAAAAAPAGAPLRQAAPPAPPPPAPLQFDEVADAVRYDLILVMDRFDYQEVLKEVAVLDAINPGGFYAGRVRRLGPFGMAARGARPERVPADIGDPSYGLHDAPAAELAAVRGAAAALAVACRGLATYLLALSARAGGLPLRECLAQSLRCPLLAGGLAATPARLAARAPPRVLARGGDRAGGRLRREQGAAAFVADDASSSSSGSEADEAAGADEGAEAALAPPGGDVYSVRTVRGQRRVVRRPTRRAGFWRDPANVDAQLRAWASAAGAARLPTQRELRAGGASSLAAAVDAHGGLAAFAARTGLPMAARRPNGHWREFANVAAELAPLLRAGAGPGGAPLLPTQAELLAAGRADLVRALRLHGGAGAVAARLGAATRHAPAGRTEAELLAELQSWRGGGDAAAAGADAALPTRAALVAGGRADLADAVGRLGGFKHFQRLADGGAPAPPAPGAASGAAPPPRRARGPAAEREPVVEAAGRGVLAWAAARGDPRRVPTRAELLAAGRPDLWHAVQRAGGVRRVAEHLGLPHVETRGRRPRAGGAVAAAGAAAADLRAEMDALDAYESVVFV